MNLDFYAKTPQHIRNNQEFLDIMARYPWMKLYQPNADKAPWHVQAKLTTAIGYTIFLNFWPHVAKAQMDGEGAVQGWDAIKAMICRAIDACDDDFDIVADE